MTAEDEQDRDDLTDNNRESLLRSLFEEAIHLPEDGRSEFISRSCDGDPELRKRLEDLLLHHVPEAVQATEENVGTQTDPSNAELHWVGHTIGDVTIRNVIGSGGMGTVYTAMQRSPQRTVAVKILREAIPSVRALRRFEFEAQLLARMNHPGIARVIRADTIEERGIKIPYFVMDLIENASTVIDHANEQGLGRREKLVLFRSICDAVGHAHQKGIIHRDIKPANVLIDETGQARVIDFGIAFPMDDTTSETLFRTFAQRIVGTPHYMAPEQFDQPDSIDTRIDVYALGVLLYELLLNQPPHRAEPGSTVMARNDDAPIRPISLDRSVKGDLEAIMLKALDANPERRYADANAFGDDIDRHLNQQPVMAKTPTFTYAIGKIARRNRTALSAVAACLLVLVAAAIFAGYEKSKAAAEVREALEYESRKTEVFEKILRRMSVSSVAAQISKEDLDGPGRDQVTQTARSLMSNLIFMPSVEDLAMTGEKNPDIAIELGTTLARFAWHANLPEDQLAIAKQQLHWAQQLDPPDPLILAKTHGYVAMAESNRGQHEKALESYATKKRILAGIEDPEARRAEWYVLNNSSASLEKLGQLEAAEAGYRECLSIARSREDDQGMVDWSHRNLGRVLLAQGRNEAAYEEISQCNTITILLDRSDFILQMNQFYLEEAQIYLDAARRTGRTAEELAVSEVLCDFRGKSPELISTPYFDSICERTRELRETLGIPQETTVTGETDNEQPGESE
jgi:tRNA A-37 threonylcarbamoyl transferase component Bud32/tetratricopeptide (TPR) repeat protein